jgi:beta-lactam-binding protein with PASTA domain
MRISKRVVIASVPLVSLLMVALDPKARPALAVNEFASPPSPRASHVLKAPIREPRVLRAPDLVGQPVGAARATLESRGLRAGREQSRLTTEHRPGTVLAQEPRPGAPVESGSAISLWIAATPARTPDRAVPTPELPRPPRSVLVPDLIHRPANQVASILEHSGLRLGEQRREESVAPAGTVTRQTPEAGMRVRPGTTVDVAVAIPLLIPVPDLRGHSLERARELLTRARLTVGTSRARPSDAPAGTVLGQSPVAGTRTRPGTAVNVAIAVAITAPVPPAPRPPTPVVQQPKPDPVAPSAPAPSAPVVVPPSVVVAPPAAVAEPPRARWPRRLAWGLGSALLLAAGGAVYYRRATLGTGQQPVTLPTLAFGPHWDTGTQRIGPAGPLRNGSGLRLVSGLEMGTSNIEEDHLVGAAHDTGGLRR